MTFGKNRVQYSNNFWRYHRYDRYDTYYTKDAEEMALTVSEIATKKIDEIETFFGYGLQKRIIFLCYKRLSDFRQSNVGYDSGNENSNIGGVTQIVDNKVFVYFEGDTKSLEKQITSGITQLIINDMLYSGNYRQKLTNSTLITLPEWYQSGLVSFLSEEWSFDIENRIKDGFDSKKFNKINHLTGEDAKFAGHSFWYFIGKTYGKDVIPNIIYLTRINKNAESGFNLVLGNTVKELTPLWKDYYKSIFTQENPKQELPSKESEVIKPKKTVLIQNVKISPDNKFLAFVKNDMGKYKVVIYNNETKKKKTIRTKGHKLEQITDYSFPVIAWHSSSKMLTFFVEEQGRLTMFKYLTDEKKLQRNNIMFFDKILSADYSQDGYKLAISGAKDGQSDVYIYNLSAANFDRITNDKADDLNPIFADNSSKVIFSSNRKTDQINDTTANSPTFDIFSCDIEAPGKKLIRITNTPYINEYQPQEYLQNTYILLTDKTGILNKELIKHDSTINYIDTAIHYRYYTTSKLLTDYNRNINEFNINKLTNSVSEIIYNKNKFHLFSGNFTENLSAQKINYSPTEFQKSYSYTLQYNDSIENQKKIAVANQKLMLDSLRANPPKDIIHPDSSEIDINNYIFEKEKHNEFYQINPIKSEAVASDSTSSEILNPTFYYLTNFYTNYIVQQVDFGFLNNSYQSFTGSAFYFNPGLNIFTKIGIYDLFEDYRISAGFRIGTNFDSYEYLFSLENLKKRIDKQFVFHRQTYLDTYYDSYGYPYNGKIFTNEFMYVWKYPFNQIASAKATLSIRHDKGVILADDYGTLLAEDGHQFFSGAKLEYIFDNTRSLGTNITAGTRFKLFGEYYQEVDQGYTNLFVVGADFRYYKPIFRNLIFASRFAASSSFGKSKLIYYLGGVDNWYVFSPDKMQFDYSVNINPNENYVYQAVATNMRGFVQNARNGTNFFVMNNEIRFPIIKFLANRPLNSEFLNSFQVIAFADAGAAWSGLTPFDEANAYNTETVTNGPITVIIDKNRWPVIYGYGFGVRSKLFGYFFRLDWAWGVDSDVVFPKIFYFSLNLDF